MYIFIMEPGWVEGRLLEESLVVARLEACMRRRSPAAVRGVLSSAVVACFHMSPRRPLLKGRNMLTILFYIPQSFSCVEIGERSGVNLNKS